MRATASWHDDEVGNYTFSTNDCDPGAVCGHYTQVNPNQIWKIYTIIPWVDNNLRCLVFINSRCLVFITMCDFGFFWVTKCKTNIYTIVLTITFVMKVG